MYSSYKDMPQENFAEVLLRTGKLAEAKTEGETLFPATEGKQQRPTNATLNYTHTRTFSNILIHMKKM